MLLSIDPQVMRAGLRDGVTSNITGTAGAGTVRFSAGVLSALRSDITFANSNGVTFGLSNNGVITASVGPGGGGLTNIQVAAAGATELRSDITFSNSNSVTFGLNAGVITASFSATQSTQPVAASATNGSFSFGTLEFVNNNGVSFGTSAGSHITASIVTGVGISASAGTAQVTRVNFSNSNGISFFCNSTAVPAYIYADCDRAGTNTALSTIAGSTMSFGVNTSGVTIGYPKWITSWTTAKGSINISAGTSSVITTGITFSNLNDITWGNNAGVITAVYDNLRAGTDTSVETVAGSTLAFSVDTSGITIAHPNWLTTVPAGGGITNVVLSAGSITTAASAFTFSNSNNISFGLGSGASTQVITASASQSNQPVAASASDGSFLFSTLQFVNGPNITFGTSAGDVITASARAQSVQPVAADVQGTSFLFSTLNFGNWGSGVSFSTSLGNVVVAKVKSDWAGTNTAVSTIAGTDITLGVNTSGATIGYPKWITTAAESSGHLSNFCNALFLAGNRTTAAYSNSFLVLPLTIPFNLSIGYLRFLGTASFSSTSIASTVTNQTTWTTFNETVRHNVVIYTQGVGANSRSLQYLFSRSAGLTWSVSVIQGQSLSASQMSISQAITFPNEGFTTDSISTQYSISSASGLIYTTQWSNLSGPRYLDIPFSTSLSAGNYWMAFNRDVGIAGGKAMDFGISYVAITQGGSTFANFNSATNATNGGIPFGNGLFTKAASGTTSSIAFSHVSISSVQHVPVIEFIRQA